MVDKETFRKMALSFPDSAELPHFEKASFRVKRKIFATLNAGGEKAMLKLSLPDQSVFCSFDLSIIYPVPGFWGKQGATYFELKKIRKPMLRDAMKLAYEQIASKSKKTEQKEKNAAPECRVIKTNQI